MHVVYCKYRRYPGMKWLCYVKALGAYYAHKNKVYTYDTCMSHRCIASQASHMLLLHRNTFPKCDMYSITLSPHNNLKGNTGNYAVCNIRYFVNAKLRVDYYTSRMKCKDYYPPCGPWAFRNALHRMRMCTGYYVPLSACTVFAGCHLVFYTYTY